MSDLTNLEIAMRREDDEFTISRARSFDGRVTRLLIAPSWDRPASDSLAKLHHDHSLRGELDSAWAARPLEMVEFRGRPALMAEDPGGEFLDELLGGHLGVAKCLRLAIGMAHALAGLHARGLVHKDVKPSNFLVKIETGEAWLKGFGLTSRLPRHRQAPEPPELIAGTLAYMAPEQTGRMNRSIDSRSDLYALGVTLYEAFVGMLPFTASDPMEWVHCHIAREPIPPRERCSEIPESVSEIILKLMAKTPEARYQTAAGAEADLRRCLAASEAQGRIDAFPLGTRDASDQLLIPEKLYGREEEIARLVAAFDRVASYGAKEFVLVSGYSGVGKSSVVHELHKVLVPPRGLFASGKFDQYQRNIPYATLTQAFQKLVGHVLSRGDSEISLWREAIQDALDQNGQLIVNLIPELALITGKQPPAVEPPPQEAQTRFQTLFRRFLSVFARPEHPLVLFLDDLQWLDPATLDLIKHLMTAPDIHHLMIVGAYRDNEVDAQHPLMRTRAEIVAAGGAVSQIVLAPLLADHIAQFVADALHVETERARPLGELIYEKAGGNPFFTIQFITELAEENLLSFDAERFCWLWDLDRIKAKGISDNLADLMATKLGRLPGAVREALGQLACLGNTAEIGTLARVLDRTEEEVEAAFRDALEVGLIVRASRSITFIHDRVHEAAYATIPHIERAAAHLRIGRSLLSKTLPADLEETIFQIVDQFERGCAEIALGEERIQVAGLNLIAGRRAKISTAYASALKYLHAGRRLLIGDIWDDHYELFFSIEYFLAECELLTADMTAAEGRLTRLAERAKIAHDIALVTRLRLTLYTALDRSDHAVEVFLEYLRGRGTNWSAHPTQEEVSKEYDQIWFLLGDRQIEELIDLPLITDPDVLDVLDVFTEIVTPALFCDAGFLALVICRMVSLSLEHGNCDGSCYAYVWLGILAGSRFGNYQAGFQFGKLGCDLVEARGLRRYQARTYNDFGGLIIPWTRHVKTARELQLRCFSAANTVGDLTYAAYSRNVLYTNFLAAGDPLAMVQPEIEAGLGFATNARFGLVIDIVTVQLAFVRTLRGLTVEFGTLNDESFDELRFERHLASDPVLALPECWYWIRKLQARFLAGDYPSAIEASLNAERLLWTSPSVLEESTSQKARPVRQFSPSFELAEYDFYSALARAALCDATATEGIGHFKALEAHGKQLSIWAKNCPENFENRAALVSAEIARIEGRKLDAEHLYEQAIRSARANGFVHNEGIAHEVAAQFYAARGFSMIADTYLRNAMACYDHWGAAGKVKQLKLRYRQLRAQQTSSSFNATAAQLDAETVVKAVQALSGEMNPPRLIEKLMRLAIENAGAERGLLILQYGDGPRIEAAATTERGTVGVVVRQTGITSADLPQSILQYVLRTRERLVFDDVSAGTSHADDPYVRENRPKSVLCMPILTGPTVIGALYLENNLAAHTFSADRVAVLGFLASQAAISLENARLYVALSRSEALLAEGQKISHTGSWTWNLSADKVFSSEENDRIFGFSPGEAESSSSVFLERVHPEDRGLLQKTLDHAIQKKGDFTVEYRVVRPDGSVRDIQTKGRFSVKGTDDYIGINMDITDRKKAEEQLRRSDANLRQIQAELAHVSRVTTMGELAASIAHEVNQPIAGVVINGNACLRWLARVKGESAELEEARETLQRIIRDGNRAGEIIARIRALFKKKEFAREPLDLNGAIGEIVVLARSEMEKQQVALQLELLPAPPRVLGDRVQLQQVILNLILNAIEAMAAVQERTRDLIIRTQICEEREVLVSIHDSGIGIDPEKMEDVFTAFRTTKPGGLGMGLSISRSIVENHGGRLWVTSHDGPGVTFQFTLPTHSIPN